jgi:hypothetical protein
VLNGVLPRRAAAAGAAASIVRATGIRDKCPEIRMPRRAAAGGAPRAEKFVKVICSMQSDGYTRRKEYRFKQSSA